MKFKKKFKSIFTLYPVNKTLVLLMLFFATTAMLAGRSKASDKRAKLNQFPGQTIRTQGAEISLKEKFNRGNSLHLQDKPSDLTGQLDITGLYVRKTATDIVFTLVFPRKPEFLYNKTGSFAIYMDTDNNVNTGYKYDKYKIAGADYRLVKNGKLTYFEGQDRSYFKNWKKSSHNGRQFSINQIGNLFYLDVSVPMAALKLNADASFKLAVLIFNKKHKPVDYLPIKGASFEVKLNSFSTVKMDKKLYEMGGKFSHNQGRDNIKFSNAPFTYNAFNRLTNQQNSILNIPTWQGDFTFGQQLDGPAENLLQNSGFEQLNQNNTLAGWRVEFVGGAKGKAELDRSYSKSGKASLKITKENAIGYIVISSTMPIKNLPYRKLSLQGYYHTHDATPGYSMATLRINNEDKMVWDRKRYGKGNRRFEYFINMPKDRWDKHFFEHLKIDLKTKTVTVNIYSLGNPHTIWWDDLTLEDWSEFNTRFKASLKKTTPKPKMISLTQLKSEIKKDIDHTAKIISQDNRTMLLIDGKQTTPVLFKGALKAAYTGDVIEQYGGVKLQAVHLDYRKGLWLAKDKFTPKPVIEIFEKALRSAPDSLFIAYLDMHFYKDFLKDFPEDGWVDYDGKKAYGSSIHLKGFGDKKKASYRYWPSYMGKNYQDQLKKATIALIKRFKELGYSKRIVGYHICGGHDNQWTMRQFDYSKSAMVWFKRWLREKYLTDKNLATAWRQPGLTFATVKFPKPQPNNNRGIYDTFYTPKEQSHVDLFKFEKLATSLIYDTMGKLLKKAAGKAVFIGRGSQGLGSGTMHGAINLNTLVSSKITDYHVSPPAYRLRLPGYPNGYKYPFRSYNLNGKLMVSELDLRGYLTDNGLFRGSFYGPGSLGQAKSFKTWQVVTRKAIADIMVHNQAYWYFDIGGGEFDDLKMQKDIKTMGMNYQDLIKKKSDWRPEVVLVMDEESLFWLQIPKHRWMFFPSVTQTELPKYLAGAGVPFDTILFEDLAKHQSTHNYKVYIFLNLQKVDKKKTAILNALKRDNKTLVWLSGSGFINEKTRSVKNIKKLTGFNVKFIPEYSKQSILPIANCRDNLAENLTGQLSVAHLKSFGQHLDLVHYNKFRKGYFNPAKFNILPTANVTALAKYPEDNQTAIAVRRFPAWTSVFIGAAGGLSPRLLNNIARDAGAFVASEPGIEIALNENFLSVHCLIPGNYTINLPKVSDVINLYNNKKVATKVSKINLKVEAQTIYWFKLNLKREIMF